MAKYRYLLFDLDGTLFDYDRAEAQALQSTCRAFALDYSPGLLQIYRELNGKLWKDFEQGRITPERLKIKRFEQLSEAVQVHFDPDAFSDYYLQELARGTDLIPGAEELIRSLEDRFELLLITNGLSQVQRPRIAHSALAAYFSEVIISEEVGYAKPDSKIFESVFEKINYPSRETVLMVGDSLTSDICGAHSYGLDTCWFNPLGQPNESVVLPTYQIARLEELYTILVCGDD
mgnify:CR=1 FL=1